MKDQRVSWLLLLALLSPVLLAEPAQAETFSESVVSAPCTLHLGSDEVLLDFTSVIDRYLYRYGLTPSRTFTLHLDECGSTILTGAKLLLAGRESAELPGSLAFDGTGTARGVVFGLQTADGQALPINSRANLDNALVPTGRTIALRAYLEVEPSAQSSRNIVLQNFRATVFLALDYQ